MPVFSLICSETEHKLHQGNRGFSVLITQIKSPVTYTFGCYRSVPALYQKLDALVTCVKMQAVSLPHPEKFTSIHSSALGTCFATYKGFISIWLRYILTKVIKYIVPLRWVRHICRNGILPVADTEAGATVGPLPRFTPSCRYSLSPAISRVCPHLPPATIPWRAGHGQSLDGARGGARSYIWWVGHSQG